ncbi:MAG TPA: hypothetical protein GXX75_06070 [Clostridiales bacterium]|nr:hypothetical protein [Clostridiales bacterium]
MIEFKGKALLLLVFILLLSGCSKTNENNQIGIPDKQPDKISLSPAPTEKINNTASGLFSDIDNFEISNPKTYYDERFKFSVDYPEDWESYAGNSSETDTLDGDPQGGIDIYINSIKDDWIYVYGQDGHISIPSYGEGEEREEFTTNEGISGIIRFIRSDGKVKLNLVLEKEFNGVIIEAEEKNFDSNKQQILGILKSIQINKQ